MIVLGLKWMKVYDVAEEEADEVGCSGMVGNETSPVSVNVNIHSPARQWGVASLVKV